MQKFGFLSCLGKSSALVRDLWFKLLLAAFLRELLSLVVAGVVFSCLVDWKGWNLVAALVARCLAWAPLQAGYLKLCLNACENDQVHLKDLFCGLPLALPLLLATICFCGAVSLGLAFLIVPGLIICIRCSLYGFAVVDQKTGPLKSLLSSHRMLKGFARCAIGLVLVYCIGVLYLGWLVFSFESLLVVSLGKLYRQIQSESLSA